MAKIVKLKTNKVPQAECFVRQCLPLFAYIRGFGAGWRNRRQEETQIKHFTVYFSCAGLKALVRKQLNGFYLNLLTYPCRTFLMLQAYHESTKQKQLVRAFLPCKCSLTNRSRQPEFTVLHIQGTNPVNLQGRATV